MRFSALLTLALCAGPAAAEESPTLETEHCAVFGVEGVPDEAMQMAASQCERFYASIQELLGDAPDSRIVIVLQGNAERPDGSWGYPSVDNWGRIHLYQFTPEIESYFSALAHEMVHVFRFHRRTNRDWFFEEGFAEFVALRVDPSLAGFPWFGFPVDLVAGQWLASRQDIPLATLRAQHARLNLPCKAQSYSLRSSFFDYLGRAFGDEKLLEMARREGAGSDLHYETTFGASFDDLEFQWREELLKEYGAIPSVDELTEAYRDSPIQYSPVCEEGVDF